jgi:prepilin-type N-terminal cleavage/methylation domain-containing protein
MMPRRAFTLVEMLVVVAIIAVLAGLLIPTVGMVRRMANDLKCGSQLQQIGGAIEVFKQHNDERFPKHLIGSQVGTPTTANDTAVLINSDPQLRGLGKLFICPRDAQRGKDPKMGRGSFDDLSYLYDSGPVFDRIVGSSYLFEASGAPLQSTRQLGWFYTIADQAPFTSDGEPMPTWATAKRNQLLNGSPDSLGMVYSGPFTPAYFPIIRCFWHHQWTGPDRRLAKKVKNVSWELNIFESTPYWESDANPLITRPN